MPAVKHSLAVCCDFADLLEYPDAELASRADACISRLEAADQTAAALVKEFRQRLGEKTPGLLEETYTTAFDMRPDGCLYVGHHLFGENYRRNLFLSQLKDHYRAHGYSSGNELPDYLPAMLRFVAEHETEGETQELIDECLVPAVRKLAAGDGVYAPLLRAVLRYLSGEAAL